MTSLVSNTELLYSMPSVGPTKTTTTASVVSAAAASAFQMPALESLWMLSNMTGKSIHIEAAGAYDAGAVTNLLAVQFDTTPGTALTSVAATGAVTLASLTTGTWGLDLNLTCVGVTSITQVNWFANGVVWYGGAASTTANTQFTLGGANTAGIPATVALNPSLLYYPELWSTFGTAPTAFVCSMFKVYAEN